MVTVLKRLVRPLSKEQRIFHRQFLFISSLLLAPASYYRNVCALKIVEREVALLTDSPRRC